MGLVVVNEGRIAWLGPEGERHPDGRAISSSSMFPGVAIALAVFGFHLLGDVLRGRLDPRLRGRA